MTLLDLAPSQVGRIISLGGNPEFISRLMEMGFQEGIKVRMIQKMPLNGPIKIRIRNGMISLRHNDAGNITVRLNV
jgi:Fe2+ transport system protein FeoA|tara:strand:+ start:642 stop:869 length:228 start_codon:yes stop_codon:yes gene_type:complete